MRIIRSAVVLGLLAAFLVGGNAISAQAASPAGSSSATTVPARPATGDEVGVTAWADCPAGNFCIWSGPNATGSMCKWSNADNDWYSGSIVCSWADNQPLRSAYNNGTSTSYAGVWVYTGANYTGTAYCPLRRGYAWYDVSIWGRSHQWRTVSC